MADAAPPDVPSLSLDRSSLAGDQWSSDASGRTSVPHPPLLPAYTSLAPYNAIVVELDEDPSIRLVGNLVAAEDAPINSVDAATIEIGEPVRVVFQRVGEVSLPRWVRT